MGNMKTIKSILEARKDTVVMTFGRMNPPTAGHELLVNAVLTVAKKNNADHVIYLSKSQDPKKNPLSVEQKVAYARHSFRGANIVGASDSIRTFLEAAKALSNTHKNLIMVAGSDRVSEFKTLLERYNGKDYKFSKILVVSAGERDPDNDSISGMSATKMRQAAQDNDFDKFKKGTPSHMTVMMARRMFDDVRAGMNITEEVNTVRDSYLKEEIFNIGDIVTYQEKEFAILYRGPNYVVLENKQKVWLTDITPTNKVNETIMIRQQDKIRAARIIAMALGYEEAEDKTNPTLIVNTALRLIRNKSLNQEAKNILVRMLELATKMEITYDQKLVDSLNLQSRYVQIANKVVESDEETEELSDEEIDDMINSLSDDEMIEHGYEDEEFVVIDEETGEVLESEETTALNEVLSRMERMRAKVRMARTKAKRERAAKIALHRASPTPVIAKRARRLAVKALEKRIARKPLNKLSIEEKERLEKRISKMGNAITRIAARMLPRVRKLEKTRLGR